MTTLIKPDHKAIANYHQRLNEARASKDSQHEGNIRHAFANLLESTAKAKDWRLVQELSVRVQGRTIRYDGVLRDSYNLPHGYWEAKDSSDNLDVEIRNKRDKNYSFKNIIFEDTQEAVLFQGGYEVIRADVDDPDGLADLLSRFYTHEIAPFRDFDAAIAHFQEEIPHIAQTLNHRIKQSHKDNKRFKAAYADFMELCKTALNPNISADAVDEMLIQHMLTERLIRKVFDVETFVQRNVIAAEIEKVIAALTSKHFNRKAFLGALDRFYTVIEKAADELATFTEKQHFINTVYERFFQGYSVKVADTHGIVYTPQEIVDFMCAAVQETLMDEFGLTLGDPGVHILDPCTGTGNFIVNLINRVPIRDLERVYRQQLFANEVMLLPYYVAALNIEHAYYDRTGNYEPFDGLSFVDTLDLAESDQMRMSFMTEANTERVERQKKAAINVIIGNPPYNVGQLNENDNNKNRAYEVIDGRVKDTYAKDSKATLKMQLYDAYVKFIRWATDRLGDRDGIVCYVTNNGFLEGSPFDGMRKHIMQDFTRIYVIDLKGDVRRDSMRDGIPIGEEHTVFGKAAMVGISIIVLVRNSANEDHKLFYAAADWRATRVEKLGWLAKNVVLDGTHNSLNTVKWEQLTPDDRNTWLALEHAGEFDAFIPVGTKETKQAPGLDAETIFKSYSPGTMTGRDSVVRDFDQENLVQRIKRLCENYNAEVDRFGRGSTKNIDSFVSYEHIKWSDTLKRHLKQKHYAEFLAVSVRASSYRPYTKQFLYYDRILIDRGGLFRTIFPTTDLERENTIICCTSHSQVPFVVQIINNIPDVAVGGRTTQCFPFYIYDKDGSNRRENITGWALGQFQEHYANSPLQRISMRGVGPGVRSISKWDIFYYVYGLLHHPEYRERYADNLKRELPRIPYAPEFWAFSEAGKKLAELHLNYEDEEPYQLDWVVDEGQPISYQVEKMRLREKTVRSDETPYAVYDTLVINDTLTMRNIPPQAFAYRLGNRSALEWVVDQYRIKTDKRSGIKSDPNQYGDDRYIVDLVEKVVQVSVETVAIVAELAELDFRKG
jgi:predicted helicase